MWPKYRCVVFCIVTPCKITPFEVRCFKIYDICCRCFGVLYQVYWQNIRKISCLYTFLLGSFLMWHNYKGSWEKLVNFNWAGMNDFFVVIKNRMELSATQSNCLKWNFNYTLQYIWLYIQSTINTEVEWPFIEEVWDTSILCVSLSNLRRKC